MNVHKYQQQLLTPDDVSQILKVGYRTVLDLIHFGKIDSIKIGRKFRITQTSLNKYISQNTLKVNLPLR